MYIHIYVYLHICIYIYICICIYIRIHTRPKTILLKRLYPLGWRALQPLVGPERGNEEGKAYIYVYEHINMFI